MMQISRFYWIPRNPVTGQRGYFALIKEGPCPRLDQQAADKPRKAQKTTEEHDKRPL